MRITFLATLAALAVTAASSLPLVAAAEENGSVLPEAQPAATGSAGSAAQIVGPQSSGWSAAPLSDSELAGQRGGADLHVNENNATAVVRDNVASNLSTGNNSINGDSFSGMSGVPMVVQNSGNNVVIQNSTILNLQLH